MIQPRISHADHASSTTYTYELPANDLVWDDYYIKKCNYPNCYWSDSESHTFRYSALAGNSTYHKRACTKCSFYDTDTARHSYGSYSYYNTSQHRRRCLYAGIISIQITVISKAEGNYAVHPAVIQNRIHKEAI